MQTKNLVVCNYNVNTGSKIIKSFNSLQKTRLITVFLTLLLFAISFTAIKNFYNALNSISNRNISVSDFKLDINRLSETAAIIEVERTSNKSSQINSFGSDGIVMKADEIKPALTTALINIADINTDGKISDEEISALGIMRLKPDTFQKKLRELKFSLSSPDCNLKNYIIITQGKYAGTILYNGSLKFIDDQNKQYFGLELFS